jgi:hypothetical protein
MTSSAATSFRKSRPSWAASARHRRVSQLLSEGGHTRHVRRRGERQRRDDLGPPLSINFNLLTLDRGSNYAADLAEHLRDLGANLHRTDDRLALLSVRGSGGAEPARPSLASSSSSNTVF